MESLIRTATSARPALGGQRTADVLVDILVEAGVDVVWNLPGGTIAPLLDALIDRPQIRVITTRHEAGAMFAAAGYARVTGKLGVVLVTSGPGVINAMTGLASANCDGLPVLLLSGEVARKSFGRPALQEGSAQGLNIVEMVSHISKFAAQVNDADSAPTILRRAIATALSGRRGPAVVTIPVDVSNAQTLAPRIALDVGPSFAIPAWALEEVALTLAESRRTILFAGSGVRDGDGPAGLLRLAERLHCPVMTTPKGKGVFPENHPLSVGVYGLGGHPSSQELVDAGFDVLLAVGTSLGDLSTNGWSDALKPRRKLIHVDIDVQQIGRAYAANLAIVAPAAQFFDRLLEWLPRPAPPPVEPPYGVRRHSDAAADVRTPPGKIAPARALWELQQVLPPSAIYTCDSGEHFLFAVHYLETRAPDGFVVMSGLGAMGSGIGAGFGVKLAYPDRPVAVICGDGGFAMAAGEISTAVAERLPILFFVMNNERLGMVENGNNAIFGRTPQYSTAPMNVVQLATALGAQAIKIDAPGQILDMAIFINRARGPIVLDVRIDGDVKLPKNSRLDSLKTTTTLRVMN